jgi:hypothetical protein
VVTTGSRWQANQVDRAQGIVSVQADCTTDDALRKMTDRARLIGQTLEEIARAIIGHRIWFR